MKKFNQGSGDNGSALLEVVVAASILAMVSVAMLGSFALLSRFHEKNMMAIKGELLAEEGMEIVRLVKATGWSAFNLVPIGQDRYFSLATSSWSFTDVPEVVDGVFSRSFKKYSVSRDATSDIVSVGGTIDDNTFLIEVTVAWSWRNATSTAIYKSYVTSI